TQVPASSSALALAPKVGRRELLPTIAVVMAVTPNATSPSLPAPGVAQPGIRSGASSSNSFH
ncbi:Os01g0229900, partial [Oryza sativa Japonica Group]